MRKGQCIGHANFEQVQRAVKDFRLGAPLNASGATISAECLQSLFAALASDDSEMQASPLGSIHKPAFPGEVSFEKANFVGVADFAHAVFKGPAYFDGATFDDRADFRQVEFQDHADFDEAAFKNGVNFRGAIFNDHAGFERMLAAQDKAVFIAARFRSYVDFEQASFCNGLDMTGVTFQLARRLGPLDVCGSFVLDNCVFAERVSIDAIANRLSATSAVFADGARLGFGGGDIQMKGVDFGRATTLSRYQAPDTPNEKQARRPRLLSLYGAQVASLSLSGINVEACRFFGAHGLESMIIEPSCKWRHTPPHRRCIDREILLEEEEWRLQDERKRHARRRLTRHHQKSPWARHSASNETGDAGAAEYTPLEPNQLAALYRALRKAREENKDQAGAGDLYYGEMEMRRRSELPVGRGRIRAFCDKLIITAYWLLSGYGLKASRAFAFWCSLIVIASFAITRWGLNPSLPFPRSLAFTAESTSGHLRIAAIPRGYELNGVGEGIRACLRILGPVLIGLWLLALRNRVKR